MSNCLNLSINKGNWLISNNVNNHICKGRAFMFRKSANTSESFVLWNKIIRFLDYRVKRFLLQHILKGNKGVGIRIHMPTPSRKFGRYIQKEKQYAGNLMDGGLAPNLITITKQKRDLLQMPYLSMWDNMRLAFFNELSRKEDLIPF